MKTFSRYSSNFARNKDLPAGFHYGFSLYILSSQWIFQYSSFSLVSKSTNIFRLFHQNRCNPYRKSIKMIFPDVFRESIMWLSGELLHEWLFTRDSIVWIRLSWKNDLLSYVIKPPAVEIQIMRIFSHPRAEIYEINTLSPLCTGLPLLRVKFTADYQQNASARTDDARRILKKDLESA